MPRCFLGCALLLASLSVGVAAEPPRAKAGVVVMHGKGGSPSRLVSELAAFLEHKGYAVANLEMPWSGQRDYDADVPAAEKEVAAALVSLRGKGATRLFIAGHSQGGVFALYLGGRLQIDGLIAIAPGGNVANVLFREKLGESVALARKLVSEGKGGERTQFLDFESSRGTSAVVTTPAIYLSWFDPAGAMNQLASTKRIDPRVPVLFIVPTRDYPGLVRVKSMMFDALPRHPLTRLYEPDADHRGAPSAAREEIAHWMDQVASAPTPAAPHR